MQKPPIFDLEERTTAFARDVRDFVRLLPSTRANVIYFDQLLRAASSVGANYIEGNDAIGRGDFLVKVKTSRREAREARYWLRLLEVGDNQQFIQNREMLIDEAGQLVKILSTI